MNFADRLTEAIEASNSIAVVGLDPRLNLLPPSLLAEHRDATVGSASAIADAFLAFNKGIIDVVAGKAAAVKPQIAFYEQYGWHGYKAYQETVAYAKGKGLLVIGDVKRGDISSTAKAYADGHLGGQYAVAAVTLNPYMGFDAISPFLSYINEGESGCFILVKTSNPSSGDVQDLTSGDKHIYSKVAELVDSWGADSVGECGYSAVGAVVGATYPAELKALRSVMKKSYLLIPGYGAQGGGAADIKNGLDENGMGALVNSSRGIIGSFKDKLQANEDWRDYVSAALEAMNKDINAIR